MAGLEIPIDLMTQIVDVGNLTLDDYMYLVKSDETVKKDKSKDTYVDLSFIEDDILGYKRKIENTYLNSEFNIPTGNAVKTGIDAGFASGFVQNVDFTAVNVMSKVQNVDGVGSGLDVGFFANGIKSVDGLFLSNDNGHIPSEKASKNFIDKIANYDVIIYTQAEFDVVFANGASLENISIYLKNNGTPYVLNNAIQLKSNVIIHSDGAVVNKGVIGNRFSTDYKVTTVASSNSGDLLTVTSSTGFNVGDIIHIDLISDEFHTIKDIPDETHIQLTREPNVAISAITVSSMTTGIKTKGWIFDGQGGVNSLPGIITDTAYGAAFYIPYCAHSSFEAEVRNFKTTGNGGGYNGGDKRTYNLIISNVHDCHANTRGGGVYFCNYSVISNIYNCSLNADGNGGGLSNCEYSIISNVHHCQSTGTNGKGGGLYYCNYSIISNIHHCSTTTDGGGICSCSYAVISNVYNCICGTYGGGLYDCKYTIISNVYNCSTTTHGGGVAYCHYSIISNIHHCICGTYGGGLYQSQHSTISNVYDCSANTGGGVDSCHYSIFLGYWGNNTASVDDNINNSVGSWGFAHDDSINYLGIKTRTTINWDTAVVAN